MAQANTHKLVLLYMMKFLLEETDEANTLNAVQISKKLEAFGFETDRRTVYSNIDILRDFGLDIIRNETGRTGGYYIASREFDLPELKLLVDAVQASKFITVKKSEELIEKLGRLTNVYQAKQLNREVYIRNRMKTGNEKIYYSVDAIYEAMGADCQISFHYAEWSPEKKLVEKKDGAEYVISPWALTWSDENYYLIAYDEKDKKIKHYRVDKMLRMKVLESRRNGKAQFKDFDLAAYAKKTFGMYGGEDQEVTLRCENGLAGVIIDRFGKDVKMLPDGTGYFKVYLTIAVSRQFFGWITGIGEGLEIIGPEPTRKEYARYLKEILKKYKTGKG